MKEKIILKVNENTAEVTYDYAIQELQQQDLSIKPQVIDIDEYENRKTNTIRSIQSRGGTIEVYRTNSEDNFILVDTPIVKKGRQL